ncbi:MAG: pseudouridine synthase [Eubacteriales bacterium]|nr:pseudouridine synthase [Eubacteriales bacterium]
MQRDFMLKLTVPLSEEGRRLDKYLMKYFDAAPKSFIYKAFRKKNIKLGGKRADGSEILKAGDEIMLFFSDERIASLRSSGAAAGGPARGAGNAAAGAPARGAGNAAAGNVRAASGTRLTTGPAADFRIEDYCTIIYEDDNIIVADKSSGVLSQKASAGDFSLNEALLEYCRRSADKQSGTAALGAGNAAAVADGAVASAAASAAGTFTPSVCNRLDRNTSGIILFAKTYAAARELFRILKDRTAEKYYIAAVSGKVTKQGHLRSWIVKDEKNNRVSVYDSEISGADCIETEYEPVGPSVPTAARSLTAALCLTVARTLPCSGSILLQEKHIR